MMQTTPDAFDRMMQLGQLVVTGVVTWRGFKAVEAKLTNYVPVEIYRAKITELHDKIGDLREKIARLEERALK